MISDDRYDWYEEDFVAFLLSLDLPAYRKDMPIDKAVKGEQESFVNAFNDMLTKKRFRFFSDAFYSELSSILPQISVNFNALSEIIECYDNAEMAKAEQKFDELLEALQEYLFIGDIYWPYHPTRFFRVRVSEKEKLSEPKDLFHIPYKKRHLITNERYSLAGHPCLYLASYLHIAWQECGYPHKYYYSEFQYQRDEENEWKFITFLSPRYVANTWFVAINPPEDRYLKLAKSYLLTYPLIFACSIVNLNGNSAFKPEYVIPQMLTQWVYRHYDIAKGIKYFSCYNTDDIRHFNGYNVVLPAKNIDYRRGLSKDLVSKFKVSKPQLLENKLGENEAETVKKYKQDLIATFHDSFRESHDCLLRMYELTDLLDKSIRNTESTDMGLIICAIRNVSLCGSALIKNYPKEDVVDAIRSSATFSNRLEGKVTAFSSIYDRFKTDIIGTADAFDLLMDRITTPAPEEFYFV